MSLRIHPQPIIPDLMSPSVNLAPLCSLPPPCSSTRSSGRRQLRTGCLGAPAGQNFAGDWIAWGPLNLNHHPLPTFLFFSRYCAFPLVETLVRFLPSSRSFDAVTESLSVAFEGPTRSRKHATPYIRSLRAEPNTSILETSAIHLHHSPSNTPPAWRNQTG